MSFSHLPLGAYFYFAEGGSQYRKVSKSTYTYASDHKAKWEYYTPPYTKVNV